VSPSRWRQIEAIYSEALTRDRSERAGFLEQACGNDAELRREVESLFAEADHASLFRSSPEFESALQSAVALDAPPKPALTGSPPSSRRPAFYWFAIVVGSAILGFLALSGWVVYKNAISIPFRACTSGTHSPTPPKYNRCPPKVIRHEHRG